MKSFDSGKQTARKERNVSLWAKPLIKDMVVALPIGDNRHERYPEPRQGGERKPSPWGKLLPKEKTSVAEAAGKQCQVNNKPERQEKIRQIKDRLSSLGAVKERAGSERSERAGSHKAESLGKDSDGRVQLEMSYAQFLHFIERGREQEEKALLLKEEQHPVLEAMDMVFDFIAWLIGLFLSPILEEDEEKETKKDLKKEEDEWYRRRYEKSLRRAFQTEKEDDSVGMKLNGYGSKIHEQGAGTAAAIAIHERAALLHLISNRQGISCLVVAGMGSRRYHVSPHPANDPAHHPAHPLRGL